MKPETKSTAKPETISVKFSVGIRPDGVKSGVYGDLKFPEKLIPVIITIDDWKHEDFAKVFDQTSPKVILAAKFRKAASKKLFDFIETLKVPTNQVELLESQKSVLDFWEKLEIQTEPNYQLWDLIDREETTGKSEKKKAERKPLSALMLK